MDRDEMDEAVRTLLIGATNTKVRLMKLTKTKRQLMRVMSFGVALSVLMISVCQANTGSLIIEKKIEVTHSIQSIAWHPNGRHVVVGYFNHDEAEVWDIYTMQPLFKVSSKRRPINESGQEVGFSPDGRYLVVQDFEDTKHGNPPFPKKYFDRAEIEARADIKRYVLARVWDWRRGQQIANIFGPGSIAYGATQDGFCWTGGFSPRFLMHRGESVFEYDIPTGKLRSEIHLNRPFKSKPELGLSYLKMSCSPIDASVALQGPVLNRTYADVLGFNNGQRPTPIVIVDLIKRAIDNVFFSYKAINGVAYSPDGEKLISFGVAPMQIWNLNSGRKYKQQFFAYDNNVKDFVTMMEKDAVFGVSDRLDLWNLNSMTQIAKGDAPSNVFRLAVHNDSQHIAVASGKNLYIYTYKSN